MVIDKNDKAYQKIIKKGSGSVLKGLRAVKGGGLGCMAGGIVLLIFGLVFAVPDLIFGIAEGKMGGALLSAMFLIAPGLLCVVIGSVLKNKRNSSYMEFYQKETGLGEEELKQVDRELTSPNVQMIGYIKAGSRNERGIACFITDNYFVTEWYYVRRIEDMVAAAYSDSEDIWGLLCLAKNDKEVHFETYGAPADKKQGLCTEIVAALKNRKDIIPAQFFTLNGKQYDLRKNSRELLDCLETLANDH